MCETNLRQLAKVDELATALLKEIERNPMYSIVPFEGDEPPTKRDRPSRNGHKPR